MSFQLGNRDSNGALIGSFEPGGGAFPIDIVTRIVPFLYPCSECMGVMFHVVGEQHAGIGIKIPFMRRPLVSTGKGYQAICNTCANINTVLPTNVVEKLEGRVIPAQICAMYPTVCSPPEPYTQGFNEEFLARHADVSEKTLKFIRKCLEAYRREDTDRT